MLLVLGDVTGNGVTWVLGDGPDGGRTGGAPKRQLSLTPRSSQATPRSVVKQVFFVQWGDTMTGQNQKKWRAA
jgi:hypothetical protein